MTHERGKSDDSVVPKKSSNNGDAGTNRSHGNPYAGTKAETPDTDKGEPVGPGLRRPPPADGMEGRGLAERNPVRQTMPAGLSAASGM